MTTLNAGFDDLHDTPFLTRHRFDRLVVPGFVAAIWAAILAGFVPDIVGHVRAQGFSYPIIVHLHALAFTGWLILLSVQVALVETGNVALHRRLGVAGAGLAGTMVILGPMVALMMGSAAFGTPRWDPGFLSISLSDIVAFAVIVGAALVLRRDAAAHKRLMLLATIQIAGAGFGRFMGIFLHGLGGTGWWGFFVGGTLELDLLIVALGVYDIVTRGRLHPVYLPTVLALWGLQATAITLYFTPAWTAFTTHILGH
jgi:uncharacterized membrane protein YozB (DUF420 family)